MRIYLDSNVLISLIRSEIGRGFKLMYQRTEQLFLKFREDAVFVLSGVMFKEIKENCYLSKEEVLEFVGQYNLKVELIEATEKDYAKSKEFLKIKIHYPDSLHLAMALRANCNAIVTWNIDDFENAQDLIEIKQPTDFIL